MSLKYSVSVKRSKSLLHYADSLLKEFHICELAKIQRGENWESYYECYIIRPHTSWIYQAQQQHSVPVLVCHVIIFLLIPPLANVRHSLFLRALNFVLERGLLMIGFCSVNHCAVPVGTSSKANRNSCQLAINMLLLLIIIIIYKSEIFLHHLKSTKIQ